MVIARLGGAIVMVSDLGAVCAGELLSVTLNVTESLETAAVGVPVMAPVDEFKLSPAGREPLVIDHVYGGFPPVAVNVVL